MERRSRSMEALMRRRFRQIEQSLSPSKDTNPCLKFPLFISNVLFWLIGVAITVVGIYAWIEKDTFRNLGKLVNERTLFFDPALLFVLGGCIIFGIAFLGCIGALRENTCFLCTYTSLLALIFIVEVVLVILVLMNKEAVKEQANLKLVNLIKRYRDDEDLQDLVDWVQKDWLHCCGINSFRDWEMNVYFNCSSAGAGSVEACGVPFSCCKEWAAKSDGNSSIASRHNRQCGFGKLSGDSDLSTIYVEGCLRKAYRWITTHSTHLALSAGVLILTQIVGISLALGLRANIFHEKQRWAEMSFY